MSGAKLPKDPVQTSGVKKDEPAGDLLKMNSHEVSFPEEGVTEGTTLSYTIDNTLAEVDDEKNHSLYEGFRNDKEEYYDYLTYDVDGNRYNSYLYYDHTDYYDDDDDYFNNGEDNYGDNHKNYMYWYDSTAVQNQTTNCSDIGSGFHLCFQSYDEGNIEKSRERIHKDGDKSYRLDEDTIWFLRQNDDETDKYAAFDDDDNSNRIPNDRENEEIHETIPLLVANEILKPNLYFLDSIQTSARADQIDDVNITYDELNDEHGSSIVKVGQEKDSKQQNQWFEQDTGTANKSPKSITNILSDKKYDFKTSHHETPFEDVYRFIIRSKQFSDDEKHHITSLERMRRHVNRISGLKTLYSQSMDHHIVKRQLSGMEACAIFRRRRRRAAVGAEGKEKGSRSRRGIGNVGRSLEQGNPRVRQLFNQYKAMCDFISMSVFEK